MKSTKISSLFPKRGNRNTKRTEKHKNKMTHGKTYNKSPRRINHKAIKSKANTKTRKKSLKYFLNICFHALSEEFPRKSKNEFESTMVNEPSVQESFQFYCTWYKEQQRSRRACASLQNICSHVSPLSLSLSLSLSLVLLLQIYVNISDM